ncbi:hypothetical protein HDU92_006598 [Lobulomyces angularis]|nr:hypothetical protein HDU92_006598 [Lobulomyces angularis]
MVLVSRKASSNQISTERSSSHKGERRSGDILSELKKDDRFSKISRVLEKSGSLRDSLGQNELTFFAPTDLAMKKFLEIVKGSTSNEKEINMEQIVTYHIVNEEIGLSDMYSGQLLESDYVSKSLGKKDSKQKIHVLQVLGSFVLNGFVRVEQSGFHAQNGVVHPVDLVLVPPVQLTEQLFQLPYVCSTFISAVQACDLVDDMSEKGLTCFVPTNAAFKRMNLTDLIYLFSPLGRKDLTKVIQYHIGKDLLYAQDMIEEEGKQIEVPTMFKKEKIVIEVNSREKKGGRGGSRKGNKGKDKLPQDYYYVLNNGEALIDMVLCDYIVENGTSHFIDRVLIPDSVINNLPSRKFVHEDM